VTVCLIVVWCCLLFDTVLSRLACQDLAHPTAIYCSCDFSYANVLHKEKSSAWNSVSQSPNPSSTTNSVDQLESVLALIVCFGKFASFVCSFGNLPFPRAVLIYIPVDSVHKLDMNIKTLALFKPCTIYLILVAFVCRSVYLFVYCIQRFPMSYSWYWLLNYRNSTLQLKCRPASY
jgi:hypothetical protein